MPWACASASAMTMRARLAHVVQRTGARLTGGGGRVAGAAGAGRQRARLGGGCARALHRVAHAR